MRQGHQSTLLISALFITMTSLDTNADQINKYMVQDQLMFQSQQMTGNQSNTEEIMKKFRHRLNKSWSKREGTSISTQGDSENRMVRQNTDMLTSSGQRKGRR